MENQDQYKKEVIDPGDQISRLAHEINLQSYGNCPAVLVVPHQPGNFRGPVGFVWAKHILNSLTQYQTDVQGHIVSWEMTQEVENDGAGGKPQFFTLLGSEEQFRSLGWEIIAMTADDLARTGRFPAVMVNEMNIKRITPENFCYARALFEGYGAALKQSNLVNITGETAVMKHSISAFCDTGSPSQLILTWGGTCIGLARRDLLIDGSLIRPYLPIVGFREQGYRCNGGTFLTNLLLREYGPDVASISQNPAAWQFIKQITAPSISYTKTITRLLGWLPDGQIQEPLADIWGIAHITGGGLWAKFGELLPSGCGAILDNLPDPPAVLLDAQRMSLAYDDLRLTDYQAYSTFHGGCGMLLVCDDDDDADVIIKEAAQDDIKAQIVGRTFPDSNRKVTLTSRFEEKKLLNSQ